MVAKVQKELFTDKRGESSQEQFFQEEPKAELLQKYFQVNCPIEKWEIKEQQPVFLEKTEFEELKGVCSFHNQKDINQ